MKISKGSKTGWRSLLTALVFIPASCLTLALATSHTNAKQSAVASQPPGVTDTSINVGLLLPTKGALADTGQAIRAVTAAYFEEINQTGGIHGRKLELKFAETGETPAATAASLERLVTSEPVFAIVNAWTAGADREIGEVTEKNELPIVGAMTMMPQTSGRLNRQVFYLQSGVAEQSRALVTFAARSLDKTAPLAIIYKQADSFAAVSAEAVDSQSKKIGWPLPSRVSLNPGPPDAMAAAVAELKARNTQAVYLLSKDVISSFFVEAAKAEFLPQVYLLSATTTPELFSAPSGFNGKIFLTIPSAPSDLSPEGQRTFATFSLKHKLPQQRVAAQLSAYVAAQIFVEGLKLAGRDLSREKLIRSLEGLREYQTGLMQPITFGPNRRIGALGAHIITVNLEKKQYSPTGTWVDVGP